MAVKKTVAKRDYTIEGLGARSKAREAHMVRSAVLQASRDAITQSWRLVEESSALRLSTKIRIVVQPGGARRVVAEAFLRDEWVEDIEAEVDQYVESE